MPNDSFNKLSLSTQLDQVLRAYHILIAGSCENEFLQFASQFEEFRKHGYELELSNQELQEKLTKAEAEKNALTIKLKHARRQIEVELKQRHKAEQDRDELDQQILLVRELLFSDDTGTTVNLNEEQQRKLEFLNSSRYASPRCGGKPYRRRLDPIDETGSILSDYSDISFDVTEDDLDGTTLRNGKRYKRTRMAARRAYGAEEELAMHKRQKFETGSPGGFNTSYQAALHERSINLRANEQLRCTVEGPTTVSVEKLEKSFTRPAPHQGRRRQSREHRRRSAGMSSDSEAPSDIDKFWPQTMDPSAKQPPRSILKGIQKTPTKSAKRHNLQSKPCVIVKETCKPCGKRIQFGKKALKCADCRIVTHPECEYMVNDYSCDPSQYSPSTPGNEKTPSSLEDFLHSDESPQVPAIIYHTIHEIDRRGMTEVGLYRVPGMVREVRELKQKFIKGSVPDLSKVNDVHTLCSLVKDFLRETLKEPLLTFQLHHHFIEASDRDSDSDLYQAISELPRANKDTLAFMMLHLQRIVEIPEIRMGAEALSKAMGPSLIGYSCPEPSMNELQTAAIYQEKVLTRLLNLPTDYYTNIMQSSAPSRGLLRDVNRTPESYKAPESSLLGPVGLSPKKTPSSSSLAERAKKYLHGTPFGRGKRKENYFDNPCLQ